MPPIQVLFWNLLWCTWQRVKSVLKERVFPFTHWFKAAPLTTEIGQKDPDQSSSHHSLSLPLSFSAFTHQRYLSACLIVNEPSYIVRLWLLKVIQNEKEKKKSSQNVKIAEIAMKPWCSFVHCVWHNSAAIAFIGPSVARTLFISLFTWQAYIQAVLFILSACISWFISQG